MEKRIFISHSSKDSETATIICNALENNGIKCWIAPRDIPYGKEWAGEISKAISNSSAFLFLSSGNSNASKQVSREIQLAIENQVPIIPIRLDNSDYSDTNKYYLATIHCMFQYDASKVAKLVSDISKSLPKNEEGIKEKEEPENKSVKKVKKPRYNLKLLLSMAWILICALVAACLFVFTDLGNIVNLVVAVAALLGFVPLFTIRKKAIKSFTVNKKTVNLIVSLAIAGVIAIGAGAVALNEYRWYTDMENKYHITLSAPEDMTAADFQTACETVEKRMDIIADGQRYSLKVEGDTIDLIVPFEIFGELTVYDMLKCYVSRAAKLYLTTNISLSEDFSGPEVVEVTPEDIESVNILKGKIPGEPDINEKNVLDKDNYEYIEVVFKKDFYDTNKKTIEAYGDKIVFAQDKIETGNYYYFDTYKGEKDGVFYIVNDDKHPTLNEVLVYNMTSQHPAKSLLIEFIEAADWEKAEETTVFGKNQKNYDEINGNCLTFTLRASQSSNISEGAWLDTIKSIKSRLDAFNEPYALGYGINDPYLIMIKMPCEKLDYGIILTLTSNYFRINAGYSSTSLPRSYNGSKYIELIEENGIPALKLNALNDDDKKLFENLFSAASNASDDKFYLVDNIHYTPLLKAEATKGDSIIFTCFEGHEEKSQWLPGLILSIYENQIDNSVYLSLESFRFSEKDMEFGDVYLKKETRKNIEETYPVRFIEELAGNLKIAFDFTVDENLPRNMVKTAKELYKLLDFENSVFEGLSLYFIDEEGDERARIFFSKDFAPIYSYSTDELQTGYPYASGIFKNGRLDKYRDTFLKLIAEDELFKTLTDNAENDGRPFDFLWK